MDFTEMSDDELVAALEIADQAEKRARARRFALIREGHGRKRGLGVRMAAALGLEERNWYREVNRAKRPENTGESG